MNIPRSTSAAVAVALAIGLAASSARAGAREEGRLLTATEVVEEVEGMPDQRLPDLLLAHAYGIAVIPDVDKVAFIFGGRRGKGVLVVRNTLNSPWSDPSFVTLTGGSWGLQIGAQSSDIILVFTTKAGVEGLAGGRLTLGADASVATGPVGRQGSAATDLNFNSEIYSYARTRGLFGGIALDGSVLNIDGSANAALYGKSGITATEIFAGPDPEHSGTGPAVSGTSGARDADPGKRRLTGAAGRRAPGAGCRRAGARAAAHVSARTANRLAAVGIERGAPMTARSRVDRRITRAVKISCAAARVPCR